jgi:hypothetical protein
MALGEPQQGVRVHRGGQFSVKIHPAMMRRGPVGVHGFPAASGRQEPAAAQALGSKGMPDGLAEERCEAKLSSLRPKWALPKSYALNLSRRPAG